MNSFQFTFSNYHAFWRLFEILKNKCKELTDYDLRIDEEWTSKNPYYNNSVMFLERLPIKEDVGYYGDCVFFHVSNTFPFF